MAVACEPSAVEPSPAVSGVTDKPPLEQQRGPQRIDAGAPGMGSFPIADADQVVASLRPQLKACYQAGLNQDPTLSGSVVILALIAPDGTVDSASLPAPSTLSAPVDTCLIRVVRGAHFSAPGGTGSKLRIPITFQPIRHDDAGPAPLSL